MTEASRIQVTFAIASALRDLQIERLGVEELVRRAGECWTRSAKQVGWREQLRVAMRVLRGICYVVLGRVLAAAGAEHATIRQQHRGRVIAAVDRLLGQHGPGSGRRIPELRGVDRRAWIDIVEVRSLRSAGDEHRSVRQNRGIVLASAEMHRRGRMPGRVGGGEIDGFGAVGGQVRSGRP